MKLNDLTGWLLIWVALMVPALWVPEIAWTLYVATFLVVTPLLFHEMGHWALLSRYHVPIRKIYLGMGLPLIQWKRIQIGLLPIGGAVEPDPEKFAALTEKQKMHVAIAGPVASAIYAALIFVVYWYTKNTPNHNMIGLYWIGWLNLMLALINLLPIPPLDGFLFYQQWRLSRGKPVPLITQKLMTRLGHGLMYGFGFFIIASVLFK